MGYTTRNYMAHGGEELVIGGKLTFLPGAEVEGSEALFGSPASTEAVPAAHIAYVADSTATTTAALRGDLNGLLAAMREAGIMEKE